MSIEQESAIEAAAQPAQQTYDSALRTIQSEANAVLALQQKLDDNFIRACDAMFDTRGRVVVLGMGKSGHVGRKIAATLASTGTPSFFVHPAEAGHGDMGMITSEDTVLAISNSGRTDELTTLLPAIKAMGVALISMTGDPRSELAAASDAHLNVGVDIEACPHNLAPTSSTTATMVMGDALAIALLERRGFTPDDFASSHPKGALGKRLLTRVRDVAHTGVDLPRVPAHMPVVDMLAEMTTKGLGITTIVDDHNNLLGVFTDGDLRRLLGRDLNLNLETAGSVMNDKPLSVMNSQLAADALGVMEDKKIMALVVVDDRNHPVGIIHLHDILRAGVV